MPSTQPRSDRDAEYLGHWLDRGYAVVASDYAGLGTPGLMNYLSGKVEANSIVDSVIAARSAGLPLSPTWALVGQSQGAGAAMNGARYAADAVARHLVAAGELLEPGGELVGAGPVDEVQQRRHRPVVVGGCLSGSTRPRRGRHLSSRLADIRPEVLDPER